jgi:hypothetical protein
MIFALPFAEERRAIASESVSGAAYSKRGSFIKASS